MLGKHIKLFLITSLAFLLAIPTTLASADEGELENETYQLHLQSEVIKELGQGEHHLQLTNIETEETEDIVVGDSGKLTLELTKGDYQLESTKVLDGYVSANDEPIQFSVPFVTSDNGDTLYEYTIELKLEKILKDVIVEKRDKDTQARLQGAMFNVLKDGKLMYQGIESDSNGMLEIGDAEYGTYELVETKAPEGYHLLEEPHTFVIDDGVVDETLRIFIYNTAIEVPEDVQPEDKPEEPSRTFEKTGITALGSGLFIALGASGIIALVSKRKKDEE